MAQHYLKQMFNPRSIAVFGASGKPDAVGGRVLQNLKKGGYGGRLYAVNPKYTRIGNQKCHAAIDAIGEPVDLAVIATPRDTVADIIRACGEHGVRAAIVISAGFGERGGDGEAQERALQETARRYQVRILGPNCLGLIDPAIGMNASFSRNSAAPGQLALVSQSGALCTAMLDWAEARGIGFSSIVSLGDSADVDFGDVLDYLAQDPETRSILLYVEGIRDARSFMSGLRVAARLKPVIVLKAGRHHEGIRAAQTHTGAIVGGDDVFDAALQRAGAVRAATVEQLFSAARLLASPYRIKGKRLAVISNGGGLGVMATDRAMDLGIRMADMSAETVAVLDGSLPPYWSRANPVDLLGDAGPDRYRAALDACLKDPGVDGVLAMLSPQAMTDATASALIVIEAAARARKPVMACWMGGKQLAGAKKLFASHQLPDFDSPEAAVEAFAFLAVYHENQQLLMQVPGPLGRDSEPDIEGSRLIIESALAEQRTQLTLVEAKAILQAFTIPVTRSVTCRSANEALVAAESLGYPVALKIDSPDISHKSDSGGVRLNVGGAQAVRGACNHMLEEVAAKSPAARIAGITVEPMHQSPHGRELLLGVVRDPVFGPVISFGAGGVYVEAVRDRAVALPPLNTFLTERLIGQPRISALLKQYRNIPAIDMIPLTRALRRLSEMVCALPEITAMDINPLVADEHGIMALDVRIEIARVAPSLDRYRHMAIHPYPAHLVSRFQLADGINITIRPIRPEDAAIEKNFVNKLSERSRYFRFMHELKELTQEMLVRFTQLDYHRELAMIAVLDDAGAGETELAVARYAMNPDGASCEFALVVADAWQGKGIGTQLMKVLMDAARARGLKEMTGEVVPENAAMLQLVRDLGFSTAPNPADPGVRRVSKLL